jgi:hypothetical protein
MWAIINIMPNIEHIKITVGTRFGRLVVTGESQRIKKKSPTVHLYYPVLCDCGTSKLVRKDSLLQKRIVSCGCKKNEFFKQQGLGERAWNWKGGRRIEDGYVLIYEPSHPRSKSNGYIREHTIVMEKNLGRYLIKTENVHHKNGNRQDNRIENLELWNTSQPCGQRIEDKVRWAKEILQLYDSGNLMSGSAR